MFTDWIHGWTRNRWRNSAGEPVSNQDLIQYISALLIARSPWVDGRRQPNVSFQKVDAHRGIEGNEAADQLAKQALSQPAAPERDYEAEAAGVARLAASNRLE